ncbi:protein kinase [Streptomyces sp. NPDC097619]|uniref:serine/threonine-protein kinase n=1 Tax=Streptomyces sp. NPDC097619 TaxID=3157228 RepID=UPI00333080F3
MQPLEAGDPRTVGAYRLLGRLGAGGMGAVYLGRSEGGRTVAVKVVHPHFALDEDFRARFRREVAAARRVGGSWTAPVLDADPDAPVPWVATGYVAGPSLDRAIAAHGPLPESGVRAVGAGLAEALTAVHGLGLVHRDVKPSNVMLSLDRPLLIDFGIVRAADGTASLTSTGVSVGSPGYMAPEQILGRGVTAAADVFSLGAVLAFAATGVPPFTGDNSATLLYKVVHEDPEIGAGLPAGLRELVLACLAKDATARPTPAEAVAVLAPAGAAALTGPGWLPAPVLEDISRAAVRLLDLEPGPEPADRSGPVPFTSPSEPGPDAAPGTGATGTPAAEAPDAPAKTPAGVFGPPDPGYGAAALAADGPGGDPGAATPAGTGRQLSITARAGRRTSCTLALAVAGALAAVTIGGAVHFDLFPQGGGDTGRSGNADAPTTPRSATPPRGPSASAPSGTPSPSGAPSGLPGTPRGSLPDAFVGTWKGTVVSRNLNVPSQVEITFRAGRVGSVVGRDAPQDGGLPGLDCSTDWKLVSATDRALVLDSTGGGAEDRSVLCSRGSAEERFTLGADGRTLHYSSGDAAAGNPEGDLTRSP